MSCVLAFVCQLYSAHQVPLCTVGACNNFRLNSRTSNPSSACGAHLGLGAPLPVCMKGFMSLPGPAGSCCARLSPPETAGEVAAASEEEELPATRATATG